jgi:hypothetical protein
VIKSGCFGDMSVIFIFQVQVSSWTREMQYAIRTDVWAETLPWKIGHRDSWNPALQPRFKRLWKHDADIDVDAVAARVRLVGWVVDVEGGGGIFSGRCRRERTESSRTLAK